MGIVEQVCPITGETLRDKIANGEAIRPRLSAAGQAFVGGADNEARYWELRDKGKSHEAALAEVTKPSRK